MTMNRISARAVVETEAIGADVTIAEFAVVRSDVTIGNRVVIHPHVVIESGVRVGDNVEIFPGAYIGKVPKGAGALSRARSLKHGSISAPIVRLDRTQLSSTTSRSARGP